LPAPAKSQPIKVQKVVTILTRSIEPQGYEVVGTNMGGQEVCRLKVTSLSSLLLPELYKVIEENIGGDPWLVTIGGEVLPGRNQAVTLADALATARAPVNGQLAEISPTAPKPAPNGRGALLRKWLASITSKLKGRNARQ
jgi:hypothetical protein